MLICALVMLASAFGLVFYRKKLSHGQKEIGWLLFVMAAIGLLAGIFGESNEERETFSRNEYGAGDYEEAYSLDVDGVLENYNYHVKVPQQVLTREEEWHLLEEAKVEIAREFPGENRSVNHITEEVVIRDSYQNGKVAAEWYFDNYEVMDGQGKVTACGLPEEGVLVNATVELSCGEAESSESFYFRVFPGEQTKQERLLSELDAYFDNQEQTAGQEVLELPEQLLGYTLHWNRKREYLPEKIVALGGVLAVCLFFSEKEKEKKRQKERKQKLLLEYPDMLSKLVLLLGTGMTVGGAWKRIATVYENKRQIRAVPQMPLYEEMLITCREIEGGISEEQAYERFGERCGERKFRKLGNLLTQNLRKGSRGLTVLLAQEVEESYEERKSEARKYGEEAGTKLLLPMVLMMGIIMVILIVPAVLSFQI